MRRPLIWLTAIVLVALAGVTFLRGSGISAVRRHPWPLEDRVALATWRFLVPVHVKRSGNPVPASEEVLKDAREHWADHCATCHDNDGSGDTTIGRRVYPPIPDLRLPRTQNLTDGELFYAIEQGIPWTAMPGWTTGTADGERASWGLVRFVRHLPAITSDELREMERLNPKPPVNEEREKDIDDFLRGSPTTNRGGGL